MPLWSHQSRAVKLALSRPATMLAHDMGCGKTRTAIEVVRGSRPNRSLVLAPKSVVPVWPEQFREHAPDFAGAVVALERGSVAAKLETARWCWREVGDAPLILVINYESAWRKPFGDAVLKVAWDLVVCDEIHRIKANNGKASRWAGAMRRHAKRRIGLTGTPFPHSPLDIWAQYRFLDASIYQKTWTQFKSHYAILGGHRVNGRPVQILGYQNLPDLQLRFATIADRVRKEDVLDLPDATHVSRMVDLPSKARKAYAGVRDELIAMVEQGTITATNALVKCVRLQQITSGFAVLEDGGAVDVHDAKRKALEEVLEDLDRSRCVVVFCRFTRDVQAVHIAAKNAGRASVELSGQRNDVGAKWRPRKEGAVAAVQIRSGAEGVDLTAASYAVFFSQTWSLGEYSQALARLHRPGQRHAVTYVHLLAEETIDIRMGRALQQRGDTVLALLGELGR